MKLYILLISIMLLLALVIAPEPHRPLPRAEAATFTVNSLADPGDGTCTLAECTFREAIAAANAAPGADVINFSVTGTITLGSELF